MAKTAIYSLTRSLVVAALVALTATSIRAETMQVRVVDVDENPVPGVTVYIEQIGSSRVMSEPTAAVMDQRDQKFVPHVLVVQKGAEVAFPNSDVVAHHVYSFSKPNDFVLPLYKGSPPDPVRFAHDGVVTLGCNIHDSMLGYIVVVDSDIFGTTNEAGIAQLEVDSDASQWNIYAWSQRFRDSRKPLVRTVAAGEALAVTFALEKRLRPPYAEQTESVLWNDYD